VIIDQIDQELKEAMKAKNSAKVSVLRMLKSAAKNVAIEKKVEYLDDQEILKIISKQVKQNKESIEEFKKGSRQDLVEKEEAEIKILSNYLPEPLADDALNQLIEAAIQESGASKKSDMGKVMKLVLEKAAGRADGKVVSQKVAAKLS